MLVLRSWKARVALGAAVAITGSALGLYLAFRPHSVPAPQPKVGAPPVVTVGSTTVADPATAVNLTVLKTSPAKKAAHVKVDSTITLNFNLPVDPAAVYTSLSFLPALQGSFDHGASANDFVFTPNSPFDYSENVAVVLHKGLTSLSGSVLENDFIFSFVTQVGSDGASFGNGETLIAAPSGAVDVTVQLGDNVPSDVVVRTYKATSADLLKSLVHNTNGEYVKRPVDTRSMELITTNKPVKNGDTIKVTQPDGIYVLLIANGAGQYGSVWINLSQFGVLLRQDDQKIVVAGQDLTTGDTTPKFDIAFFNLLGAVQKVSSGSFSGIGEFPAQYPAHVDVAVATSGGEEMVIPVEAPATGGDIKVMGNLSQRAAIFLTTDRAAYQKGATVKYAGVARLDNDQAYTIPSAKTVNVWVGQSPILLKQSVPLAADGTFTGSFTIPPGAFNNDGTDAQMFVYASLPGSNAGSVIVLALGAHQPSGHLTVTFDQPSYFLGDTVVATIAGADNTGHPLAGTAVSLTLYAAQHPATPREIRAYPNPSTWANPMSEDPTKVTLDSTGSATYSFPANAGNLAADQEVTIVVTYGAGATAAFAARSTLVHQAADEVYLLPLRAVYSLGDTVTAPFVVETIAGERVPNAAMVYEFDKTNFQGDQNVTTVVATGNIITDANGYGVISTAFPGQGESMDLVIKGKDAAGHVFQDSRSLSVFAAGSGFSGYNSADQLLQLDVTTDKIAYAMGDKAQVTVKSPGPMTVLMSLERGRIHLYKRVTLTGGDNQIALDVTPDLAPGFTLVFAHMLKHGYITEGIAIPVNDSARLLTITVSADQPGYTAGQTAHLDVSIKDSAGNPMAATVFVDGYDAAMSDFKLVDQASIAGVFWVPALRATNASSSLVGIGSWGGTCGGGEYSGDLVPTVAGQLAVWLPSLTTDATGHATVDVPMATKTVRIALIASTPTTSVGQAELDLGVR